MKSKGYWTILNTWVLPWCLNRSSGKPASMVGLENFWKSSLAHTKLKCMPKKSRRRRLCWGRFKKKKKKSTKNQKVLNRKLGSWFKQNSPQKFLLSVANFTFLSKISKKKFLVPITKPKSFVSIHSDIRIWEWESRSLAKDWNLLGKKWKHFAPHFCQHLPSTDMHAFYYHHHMHKSQWQKKMQVSDL